MSFQPLPRPRNTHFFKNIIEIVFYVQFYSMYLPASKQTHLHFLYGLYGKDQIAEV